MMNKLYLLSLLLFTLTLSGFGQDCMKTCTVEKEVGEGVFLGVQIYSSNKFEGTKILRVVEGTEAEHIGLQVGDLIHSINGTKMETSSQLTEWVGSKRAGFPVKLAITRNGKDLEIEGKLRFKELHKIEQQICCDDNINRMSVEQISISPNPSTGNFLLKSAVDNEEPVQLQVLSQTGQVLFENTIYPKSNQINERIQVNARLNGNYVLLLKQGNNIHREKIVFVQ